MTALVACETVLLVLLVVLVAGLLRSHAEILRRLGPADDAAAGPASRRRPPYARDPPAPPPPTSRAPPRTAGQSSSRSRGRAAAPTLLAFLSSGCTTCPRFWEGLGDRRLPGELGLLVVTHDPSRESPSRLRDPRPAGVTVVMSSHACVTTACRARLLRARRRRVRGEGVATTWPALESLLSDAIADAAPSRARDRSAPTQIDARLAAAGIAPGDPSLYPDGRRRRPTRAMIELVAVGCAAAVAAAVRAAWSP